MVLRLLTMHYHHTLSTAISLSTVLNFILIFISLKSCQSDGMKKEQCTFRRENTFLMMSTVQHVNIKTFRYGVDCGDLICPSAIGNNQSVCVCKIFFEHKKSNPLYKCPFDLKENKMLLIGSFHRNNHYPNISPYWLKLGYKID